MRNIFLSSSFIVFFQFCFSQEAELNVLMNNWHQSASICSYEAYFASTDSSFVFLGTAPGERWSKSEFMTFSKPYFDRGKAWDFKPYNRKWNISADGKVAWFDEDLHTWMRGCRGSGVCVWTEQGWKISYYNLTVLIENEKMKKFIQLRDKKVKP